MSKRRNQLRELIAGADASDPFTRADILLKRGPKNRKRERINPPASGQITSTQLSNPVGERLAKAQRQWAPALRACERELRYRISIRNTSEERRLFGTREAAEAIRLYEQLIAHMQAVLEAKSIPSYTEAQLKVVEYRSAHRVLQNVQLPWPLPKLQSSGPSTQKPPKGATAVSSGGRHPSPGRPESTRGRGQGEGFAAYNRLADLNRGRSFEESVPLRQSSKRERRAIVDRIDRISSSGSREEYEDLE